MARLRLQVQRVGPHFRTVLIRGEAGTGKRLVARALHRMSRAAEGPFVVSSVMIEDAADRMAHEVKAAYGGILFLEEIGDMPIAAQTQLLGIMRRMAAPQQMTEFRMIASSRDDLRILASAGQFRPELYRQISMVEIAVPPLRERQEDIPELAMCFLRRFAGETGKRVDRIQDEAMKLLQAYQWPGNVREMESVLQAAVLQCEGTTIETHCLAALSENTASNTDEAGLARLQDVVERHVLCVLKSCGGNKLRAAEVLGISRSTLYRMLDASAAAME
jgi:DNA-binding NtrC family response regulator